MSEHTIVILLLIALILIVLYISYNLKLRLDIMEENMSTYNLSILQRLPLKPLWTVNK
jgi:hypothetical protein